MANKIDPRTFLEVLTDLEANLGGSKCGRADYMSRLTSAEARIIILGSRRMLLLLAEIETHLDRQIVGREKAGGIQIELRTFKEWFKLNLNIANISLDLPRSP